MINANRRTALGFCIVIGMLALRTKVSAQASVAETSESMERWLDFAAQSRSIDSPLYMGRFREPVYFLVESISWTPRFIEASKLSKVLVPKGFVTDLASIPPIFYSLLRPDGEFAYAAIIHDYLYWEQAGVRAQADEILKAAMQDLGVNRLKIEAIYAAVSAKGQKAWDENKRLKEEGEKRILAEFPPNAGISWDDWRRRPGVFPP